MNSIKERFPNPSDLVQFIHDAVEKHMNVDVMCQMGAYGYTTADNICYGCAATCAVVELCDEPAASVYSTTGVMQKPPFGDDTVMFEALVNSIRMGGVFLFQDMYGCTVPYSIEPFYLENVTWQTELPKMARYASQLRGVGL